MIKGAVLCDAGICYNDRCCIPVHEKCVRDSDWVKDDNFFCCREYMTGKVIYNEDGHYKNIKDSLCKFVISLQGKLFYSFQSPSSCISELKQTNIFNIFGCSVDN